MPPKIEVDSQLLTTNCKVNEPGFLKALSGPPVLATRLRESPPVWSEKRPLYLLYCLPPGSLNQTAILLLHKCSFFKLECYFPSTSNPSATALSIKTVRAATQKELVSKREWGSKLGGLEGGSFQPERRPHEESTIWEKREQQKKISGYHLHWILQISGQKERQWRKEKS